MNWQIELLDKNGIPYRMLGSTIIASRETHEEAREFGQAMVENDATVSGYRVRKNGPQSGGGETLNTLPPNR